MIYDGHVFFPDPDPDWRSVDVRDVVITLLWFLTTPGCDWPIPLETLLSLTGDDADNLAHRAALGLDWDTPDDHLVTADDCLDAIESLKVEHILRSFIAQMCDHYLTGPVDKREDCWRRMMRFNAVLLAVSK